MDPLDDDELRVLLSDWKAPNAPASLRVAARPGRATGIGVTFPRALRWLATGSIRVPVPIGVAVLIVVALWAYGRMPREVVSVPASAPVTLDDFRPVARLEPRIVGEP